MTLNLDLPQPMPPTVGSVQPWHPWILGLVAVDGRPLAEPAPHQDSYLSDCECPHDCLRDHENE